MEELIKNGSFVIPPPDYLPDDSNIIATNWEIGPPVPDPRFPDRPFRERLVDGDRVDHVVNFPDPNYYIEQPLNGYAWDDLKFLFRTKVVGEWAAHFSLIVWLYYEGRAIPDEHSPPHARIGGDEEPYWQLFTATTRRCSKLTKIRIGRIQYSPIKWVQIDDISLQGDPEYSSSECHPSRQPAPYPYMGFRYPRYLFSPNEAPFPPEGPPPFGSAGMPSGTSESLFSEMEYRLRCIENHLRDLKLIQSERLSEMKPMSQQ